MRAEIIHLLLYIAGMSFAQRQSDTQGIAAVIKLYAQPSARFGAAPPEYLQHISWSVASSCYPALYGQHTRGSCPLSTERVPYTCCSLSPSCRRQRMSEARWHAFSREAGPAGFLGQGGLSHGRTVAVFPGLCYMKRTSGPLMSTCIEQGLQCLQQAP